MNDTCLTLARTLPAPVGQVFEAWTRPEILQRWMGPGNIAVYACEADARTGGRYRIHMRDPGGKDFIVSGTYVAVVPNERLAFTWQWAEDGATETLVTIDFKGKDGGTELVLTHERFSNSQARDMHAAGWGASFDKLQGHFDGQTATVALACNCGHTVRGVDRYSVEATMWKHAFTDHREMLLGLDTPAIAQWLREKDRALAQAPAAGM